MGTLFVAVATFRFTGQVEITGNNNSHTIINCSAIKATELCSFSLKEAKEEYYHISMRARQNVSLCTLLSPQSHVSFLADAPSQMIFDKYKGERR